MAIITDSKFPVPPEGRHAFTCGEAKLLRDQETPWGVKNLLACRFDLDIVDPDSGEPYAVTVRHTATTAPGSNLRTMLKSWLGLSDVALHQFDTEDLVGKRGVAVIAHATNQKGRVYARVAEVRPPDGRGAGSAGEPKGEVPDDEVPF